MVRGSGGKSPLLCIAQPTEVASLLAYIAARCFWTMNTESVTHEFIPTGQKNNECNCLMYIPVTCCFLTLYLPNRLHSSTNSGPAAARIACETAPTYVHSHILCTQGESFLITHGLDGQHQDVDRTPRGREDRDKWRKYVSGVAGQPSDRGGLKNRTDIIL